MIIDWLRRIFMSLNTPQFDASFEMLNKHGERIFMGVKTSLCTVLYFKTLNVN